MAQGHSVDEYLETIYFLAFPIGEYTPQAGGSLPLASRGHREQAGKPRTKCSGLLARICREMSIGTAGRARTFT